MKAFPIPVVPFGPGSQPGAEEANFLPMPREMETFSMPHLHHEADPATLTAACGLLENLRHQMLKTSLHEKKSAQIELTEIAPQVIELINQSLGHGEVSILTYNTNHFRIQESVFAGIWRVQEHSPQGALLRDSIQACAIPHVVQQSAELATNCEPKLPALRDGMMNAPAVVHELQNKSRSHQPGQSAHVVNLTLLPMTQEDLDYLNEALGMGSVVILSRGYGNCRISSTTLAHVWWVQYFNSMDQIILNTLEVVDVPEAAQAAVEDYAESVDRLGEWLVAMKEEAE